MAPVFVKNFALRIHFLEERCSGKRCPIRSLQGVNFGLVEEIERLLKNRGFIAIHTKSNACKNSYSHRMDFLHYSDIILCPIKIFFHRIEVILRKRFKSDEQARTPTGRCEIKQFIIVCDPDTTLTKPVFFERNHLCEQFSRIIGISNNIIIHEDDVFA